MSEDINKPETLVFGTIVTENYLPQAERLIDSISRFMPVKVYVGVLTSSDKPIPSSDKYAVLKIPTPFERDDHNRWGAKPWLLLHMLSKHNVAFFFDSDLYFVRNPHQMLEKMKDCDVLLTPSYRPVKNDFTWRDGFYNAGFVGAKNTADGIKAIKWWNSLCTWKITRDNGYFVDQKYLDYMHIVIDGVKPLRHIGYNVGPWKSLGYQIDSDNHLIMDTDGNKHEIICYHLASRPNHPKMDWERRIYEEKIKPQEQKKLTGEL